MSVAETNGGKHVGRRMRRKEDPRLITGKGTYVDDIQVAGCLHAAIVRSPEAHAKIVSIDKSAAEARPGVRAVLTGDDLADLLERNPSPSEEEVRHGLEGNLCRCTGYHNIVKAVLDAAQNGGDGASIEPPPPPNPDAREEIGKGVGA